MSNWQRCLQLLEGEIPSENYNTWIRPLQFIEDADVVRLLAPNAFVLEWVQKNYLKRLQEMALATNNGSPVDIRLEIGTLESKTGSSATQNKAFIGKKANNKDRGFITSLNPEFSFDTFVEGKSNQIARAASIQVAENPGKANNPLFIYGGVGLGKTHLMHAVGNMIVHHNPDFRVAYIHSESFVSEMIKALQHNTIDQFKQKYRLLNTLLIDDVQFFAGKDRSQEEFFHTFNALFESQQQIVLTSDHYPKELNGLEERLKSRFGWGLTVSIEPPDLETRVAILKSKAENIFHTELADDIAFFIAKKVRSNIRELEGALRRIIANSQFTGEPISVELAQVALKDLISAHDRMISIENIQKTVADFFNIRTSDLLSSRRSRNLARPRQIAMTLAKELTNHSLPEIGEHFGGRDHTTVLYATRKVAELRREDTTFDINYLKLLRILSL